MINRDLYSRDPTTIELLNNGVSKVSEFGTDERQLRTLRFELESFVCDGEYANASSVNFYTGRQMLIFNGRINGLWYGSLFPDAAPIFIDDAQLAHAWTGPDRIYFVTGGDDRRAYLEKLGPTYALAKSGGKFVFTNRDK